MGQLLIRDLDDAIIEALRQRAVAKGICLEEEARHRLAASVGSDRKMALAGLDAVRQRIGRLSGSPSLDDLQRDRDS